MTYTFHIALNGDGCSVIVRTRKQLEKALRCAVEARCPRLEALHSGGLLEAAWKLRKKPHSYVRGVV